MDETYRAYFALLEQTGEALENLTAIQKEKTAAVRRDNLIELDRCMKREQALSLSLRMLDRKREALLKSLGIADTPLSGLAARCPRQLRAEARAVTDKLRQRFRLYQSAAEVARNTLECNLHEIDRIVEQHYGGLPDSAAGGLAGQAGAFADIRA